MSPDADLDAMFGPAVQRVRVPLGKAKRKVATHNEHILQVAAKKWLTIVIAPAGDLSRDNVAWYAVDHAASISMWQGAMRKARGVVRGIPDLDIYWNERAYKIELKVPGGVVSDEQRALHKVLRGTGVSVAVCWSLEDVHAQVATWGIPHRRTAL